MPDYGLGLAYGYENMAQDLRQRIMDQLAQKQQGFQNQQQLREMALREQEARQRAEEHAANLSERALNVRSLTEQRAQSTADRTAGLYAPGDVLPPEASASLRTGNLGGLVGQQEPTLASRDILNRPTLRLRGQMVSSAPAQAGGDYFVGTAGQREQQRRDAAAAQKEASAVDLRQQDIDRRSSEAEARVQALYDRMKQEGENQALRRQIDLAKLDVERAKGDATAAKTPQPQWFRDEKTGQFFGVIYDRGKATRVDVPAGAIPTGRASGNESWMDRLSRWWNGQSGSGAAQQPQSSATPGTGGVVSTDPNWGRR